MLHLLYYDTLPIDLCIIKINRATLYDGIIPLRRCNLTALAVLFSSLAVSSSCDVLFVAVIDLFSFSTIASLIMVALSAVPCNSY